MWVTHLVGDLHQPLHVGDKTDRGGNEVAVVIDGREGRGVNLHSIWDRDLGDHEEVGGGAMGPDIVYPRLCEKAGRERRIFR